MTTAVRVPGHTLVAEGAAHVERTVHIDTVVQIRVRDRVGRGLCSCGATSSVLPSTGQRKRWHRDHKAAVLAGGS